MIPSAAAAPCRRAARRVWGAREAGAAALAVLWPALAHALPPTQTVSDQAGDIEIGLTLLDRAIRGDRTSWCEIEATVLGAGVELRGGDRVEYSVREDGFISDAVLWERDDVATADDVSAQAMTRIFDCDLRYDPGEDGPEWEVFGRVEWAKAACGLGCFVARTLATDALDVLKVDDDSAEPDDGAAQAVTLDLSGGAAALSDRIARDEDWVAFDLTEPTDLRLTLAFRARVGVVEAVLRDESGATDLATSVAAGDGASLTAMGLAPGSYRMVLRPADPGEFNFYDAAFAAGPAAPSTSTSTSSTTETTASSSTSGTAGTTGTTTMTTDATASTGTTGGATTSEPTSSSSTAGASTSTGTGSGTTTGATAGSGGSSGASGTGASTTSAAETTADPTAASGTGSSTDSDGGAGFGEPDPGSCACRSTPADRPLPALALALLGLLSLRRRRG